MCRTLILRKRCGALLLAGASGDTGRRLSRISANTTHTLYLLPLPSSHDTPSPLWSNELVEYTTSYDHCTSLFKFGLYYNALRAIFKHLVYQQLPTTCYIIQASVSLLTNRLMFSQTQISFRWYKPGL